MLHEQDPNKHEKNPNKPSSIARLIGRLGVGNRPAPGADTKTTKDKDLDAYFAERRRQSMDKRPAGPGLKGYNLNSDLFQRSDHMSRIESEAPSFTRTMKDILDRYYGEHPEQKNYAQAEKNSEPFTALMFSGAMSSRPSQRLHAWLAEHTPQNGYFTPEMVTEAVAGSPDIIASRRTEDGIDYWKFSSPDESQSFTLSRTHNDSKPTVMTEPYLATDYWNEYDSDAGDIVSTPQINLAGQSLYKLSRSDFGAALKSCLGLGPIRLHQQIDFSVVGPKPMPTIGLATEGQGDLGHGFSFESVRAEAYVVADLPSSDPYSI